MKFSYGFIGLGVLCTLLWYSCASTGNPSGGSKDELPPAVIQDKSEENYQTNYFPEKFVLEFDEWIELKNVYKQVVISPPMLQAPKITQRGKKITVDFEEADTLRPDATYTINFGQSIVDYREGNVLNNYSFVFSTGDFIDSLSIQGFVKDAYTREPLEDVLVMLYDNLSDSAVYKERPFYFARSNEEGIFEIKHIKSDSFQLFALMDANLDYKYDGQSELMAFNDSLILLTDSFTNNIELNLFQKRPEPKVLQKENEFKGLIQLVFNERSEAVIPEAINNLEYLNNWSGDTLNIWHQTSSDSFLRFKVLEDTLVFRNYDAKDKDDNPLRLLSRNGAKRSPLPPGDSVQLIFNSPITAILQDSIALIDSSKTRVSFSLMRDSLDPRIIRLSRRWIPGVSYELIIPEKALTDYYGQTNDSISLRVFTNSSEKLGIVHVTFENLSDSLQYLAQLYKGQELHSQIPMDTISTFTWTVKNLQPGNYSITLIEDLNGNRVWDPGDYGKRRQSEKLAHFPLDEIRANWELPQTIKANFDGQ